MVNLSSRKGQVEIIIAVLIALGILILAGTGIAPKKPSTEAPSSAISGKGNDTPPLPENADTYFIQNAEAGPKIYEASINPLGGAKPGVEQTWSVKVRHSEPVQSVTVTVIMDKGSYSVPLSLVEGTALDGTWRSSWRVEDTHNKKYQAAIKAISGSAAPEVVLTFQPLEE